MLEQISLLFFIIGLGLSWFALPVLVKERTTYSNFLVAILYLLLWNSEYIAAVIMVFAVLFFLKVSDDTNSGPLKVILSHVMYIMLFTFILRKLKDIGVQYLIELNLQNIK